VTLAANSNRLSPGKGRLPNSASKSATQNENWSEAGVTSSPLNCSGVEREAAAHERQREGEPRDAEERRGEGAVESRWQAHPRPSVTAGGVRVR
jgi:hypothetical protein